VKLVVSRATEHKLGGRGDIRMDCSLRPRSPSSRPGRPALAAVGLAALVGALPAIAAGTAHDAREEFIAVTSPSVPVENVSLPELRQLFLLEKRHWKAGQPVVALLPATGSSARTFLMDRIYRFKEPELRRLIVEKMYRGEVDLAPKVVSSDAEALSFVAAGRGLIAIVPARMAGDPGVKVLRIEGRLPGASGYALSE
jgi:hypothetical protein